MSFPVPLPGLVIRYSYLWKHDEVEGREEGSKDRPCAVVVAFEDSGGRKRVFVLPITHTAPTLARKLGIPFAEAVLALMSFDETGFGCIVP